VCPVAGAVHPVEPFEHVREVLGGNAVTGVADGELDAAAGCGGGDGDGDAPA
jgi:hypothetical protein